MAAAVMMAACSGSSGVMGGKCTGQGDCTGLSNAHNTGFCNQFNVCTIACATHADCGCPPNTTDADIALGTCDYACVVIGASAACTKVCADDSQCFGTTTCQPAVDTSGNSLGYSECL